MAVINGTNSADTLTGTNSADTINGRDGADTIDGRDGADTIDGGDGADTIDGGDGADAIFGGGDDDTISGGGGRDTVDGGGGADTIDGGGGDDTISGGGGGDTIDGGGGDDLLTGDKGDDTLFGGGGSDTAEFSGKRSQYTLTFDSAANRWIVTDNKSGRDGTDIVDASVEFLRFSDQTITLNHKPDAIDDAFAVAEGAVLSGNVLADNGQGADSDPDAGTTLRVTEVNGQAVAAIGTTTIALTGGSLVISATGAFTFTQNGSFESLAQGQSAALAFTYTLSDGSFTDTAIAAITITGQNDAPAASAVTGAVSEDGPPLTVVVAFTDPDAGDTHSFVIVDPGSVQGGLTNNNNGTFTYNPAAAFQHLSAGQTATETFSYTVTDSSGVSSTNTVTVTVTGENDAPFASAVAGTVTEDGPPVTVSAAFADADTSDTHSFFIIDPGAVQGGLTNNNDGTFTYNPAAAFQHLTAGQTATETFSYSVTDSSGASSISTVTITVTGENDTPTLANALADQSAAEDAAFSFQVPANAFADVDAGDSLALSASLANGDPLPAWLSFNAATRTFSGAPANGDVGLIDVRVTATDLAGGSVSDVFSLNVAGDAVPAVIQFGSSTAGILSVARMSTGPSGAQANGVSGGGGISADGQRVAFNSTASNLVPGDTNNTQDIFSKDMTTGAITRLSANSVGAQTNGSSILLDGSDGAKLLLSSLATNLVAGDTNGTFDIFVQDLVSGAITRVSTDSTGAQANGPTVVARFMPGAQAVLFESLASNLVAGDTNTASDIFLKDLVTGAVTRLSTSASGLQANGASITPRVSADGTKIAFRSTASNLVAGDTNGVADIFVKDLVTGAVTRVSTSVAGGQADGESISVAFSPDGTKILFSSVASNLVAGDTNGQEDVFLKDLTTGAITQISTSAAGIAGNGASRFLSGVFSPDGLKVAFQSTASNLVPGDTNGTDDIFIKDLATGSIVRVSTNGAGAQTNATNLDPRFSPDGSRIIFQSGASNLVPGDTNGFPDVFVAILDQAFAGKDGGAPILLPVSVSPGESGEAVAEVVLSGLPAGSILSAGVANGDGTAWTFAGAPPADLALTSPAGYTGSFALTVTATTQQGGDTATTSATRTVTVFAANIAPTATSPITDQYVQQGTALSFQIPADAFADADVGDSLALSASLANGDPLPAWLSFNTATRTFSGTPAGGDIGAANVRVTATDLAGASISDVFVLSVVPPGGNLPPVALPVTASMSEDGPPLTVAASFSDPNVGNTFSYRFANPGAVLGALTNNNNGTFTYNPLQTFQNLAAGQTATQTIGYVVTDNGGHSSESTFTITIVGQNDAPTLASLLADQSALENAAFSFQVPLNTFADIDQGDTRALSATLSNGDPLPAWLAFNAATRIFSGTPGTSDVGPINVRVTATDLAGASASDVFALNIAGAPAMMSALSGGAPELLSAEESGGAGLTMLGEIVKEAELPFASSQSLVEVKAGGLPAGRLIENWLRERWHPSLWNDHASVSPDAALADPAAARLSPEGAARGHQVLQMIEAMAGFGATPAAEMATPSLAPSLVELTRLAADVRAA